MGQNAISYTWPYLWNSLSIATKLAKKRNVLLHVLAHTFAHMHMYFCTCACTFAHAHTATPNLIHKIIHWKRRHSKAKSCFILILTFLIIIDFVRIYNIHYTNRRRA